MKTARRFFFAAALVSLPLAPAMAQAPAPGAQAAPASTTAPTGRADRKIERIRTEDGGSRIDEVRVGGETEKITVQPKTGGIPYEIKSAEGARGTAPASTSSDTNGARVWNVFKF